MMIAIFSSLMSSLSLLDWLKGGRFESELLADDASDKDVQHKIWIPSLSVHFLVETHFGKKTNVALLGYSLRDCLSMSFS